MRGTALFPAQFLGDREAYARRNLLRAEEVFVRDVLQGAAIERYKPLIAIHVRALIDRHCQMAFAEQSSTVAIAGCNCRSDATLVETRARPHFVRRDEVYDQHPDGTVTLRLQYEPAMDL